MVVSVRVSSGGLRPEQGENNTNDQNQPQPTRQGMDSIIENIFGQGSIKGYHYHNKDEEKEKFFQERFPINGSSANMD
jgi:hypothetical protein